MRNRIFGVIGILWGGWILIAHFASGGSTAEGAYGAGQTAGLLFGALLLAAGCYTVFKGAKHKR